MLQVNKIRYMQITVNRKNIRFSPDSARVIARFLNFSNERSKNIILNEIGRLKTSLISPNNEEREGYVPNVVYSCGSIIYNGNLIVPYGMSDKDYLTKNFKYESI